MNDKDLTAVALMMGALQSNVELYEHIFILLENEGITKQVQELVDSKDEDELNDLFFEFMKEFVNKRTTADVITKT